MAKSLNPETAGGIQALAQALCSLVEMGIISKAEARTVLSEYSLLPKEDCKASANE
jgi:DNA-binding HxlR family transcriptional regulator